MYELDFKTIIKAVNHIYSDALRILEVRVVRIWDTIALKTSRNNNHYK